MEELKLKVIYTLHSTLYTLLASVSRTMTPRRVGEFKVKSEKLKAMKQQFRAPLNFTLYTLFSASRDMNIIAKIAGRWRSMKTMHQDFSAAKHRDGLGTVRVD